MSGSSEPTGSSICLLRLHRNCPQDVVSRQRSPNPLEFKLSHCLDRHGVLDLRQHPRADEDLTGFGLIAKAGGDIGNGADSGIVEAALKADSAKRGKAMGDADAEADLVPDDGSRSPSRLRGRYVVQGP
jgi:hypothetical protein